MTTDSAKSIREALKRLHGWGPRQVSVRSEPGSIRVTIRAPGIAKAAVTVIAKEHQSIRRCEVSGEILSGGNTYVSIDFAWELTQQLEKAVTVWAMTLPENGVAQSPTSALPNLQVWRHGLFDFRVELIPEGEAPHYELPLACHGANTVGTVVACMLIEQGITSLETLPATQQQYTNEVPAPPQETPIHDPKDEACRLDGEGDCIFCGLHHGSPCLTCGGRAYHRWGCPKSGGEDLLALTGMEVLVDHPFGRSGKLQGRVRKAQNGALQVDVPGYDLIWRDPADLEPAGPGPRGVGAPVVFFPWADEGPNAPMPGFIAACRGLLIEVRSVTFPTIQSLRLPTSVYHVELGTSGHAECQGNGWILASDGQVQACDACDLYPDDATATAAENALFAAKGRPRQGARLG